jgi:RNA 2',3'-cyclic 3'-phosphodiesterase
MDERKPRKRKLFAGIELDGSARTACAAVSEELRKTGFGAKYEAREKLHVTLAFLGFTEPERCEEIAVALAAVAADSSPFALSLDKLGAFPHARRPRGVYIGAREQGAQFRSLAANVRGVYAQLGFEFHDDAVAHVTIARAKESKRPLPLIEFAPISVEIRALTLFESLPDPAHKTSRYEAMSRALLRNASGG